MDNRILNIIRYLTIVHSVRSYSTLTVRQPKIDGHLWSARCRTLVMLTSDAGPTGKLVALLYISSNFDSEMVYESKRTLEAAGVQSNSFRADDKQRRRQIRMLGSFRVGYNC